MKMRDLLFEFKNLIKFGKNWESEEKSSFAAVKVFFVSDISCVSYTI